MERDAKIYIKAIMFNNNMDFAKDGKVNIEHNNIYISYSENNCDTIIGISDDIVSINKMGELTYTIILKKGESSLLHLNTPYGNVDFNVYTDCVEYTADDKCVNLQAIYTLSAGSDCVKNSITVTCEL